MDVTYVHVKTQFGFLWIVDKQKQLQIFF